MSNCDAVRNHIDAYVDNELAPESRDEMLQHLTACQTCQAEFEVRTSIKQRLRRAVLSQEVDPALQARIRASLREDPRPVWWLAWKPQFVAAAAMLAVCFGGAIAYQLGHLRFTAASQDAFVQQVSSRVPGLLRVGLRDHVHCTVFRKLPKQAPTLDALVQTMGPKYAGLLPIVQSRMPGEYQIVMAHQCRYQGRRFIHIALQGDSKLISLVISRKDDGETFGREHLTAALANSELPVYRAGAQRFEIAGFETQDYLAYVVSDLPQDKNLSITASLAPDIRTFLNKVEM